MVFVSTEGNFFHWEVRFLYFWSDLWGGGDCYGNEVIGGSGLDSLIQMLGGDVEVYYMYSRLSLVLISCLVVGPAFAWGAVAGSGAVALEESVTMAGSGAVAVVSGDSAGNGSANQVGEGFAGAPEATTQDAPEATTQDAPEATTQDAPEASLAPVGTWRYAFSEEGRRSWRPEFSVRYTAGFVTEGPAVTAGVRVDDKRALGVWLGLEDTFIDALPASICAVQTAAYLRRYVKLGSGVAV